MRAIDSPCGRRLEGSDGGGELLVRPICFDARKLDEGAPVSNARRGGATPLWNWIGDEATVFSY